MDRIVLLSTPQAQWPPEISSSGLSQIRLEELDSLLQDASGSIETWMGYCSPLDCLQRALKDEPEVNPEPLLHQWASLAERFLQERQQRPRTTHLVNLTLLSGSASNALCQRLGCDSGSHPGSRKNDDSPSGSDAAAGSHPANSLAELVISQRPMLLELYADLEGQAELFDRSPQFSPGPAAWRDPDLGSQLLRQWQEHSFRLQSALNATDQQASQIEQLQTERDQLQAALSDALRRCEQLSSASVEDRRRLEAEQRQLQSERDQLQTERDQAHRELADQRQQRDKLQEALAQQQAALSDALQRSETISTEATALQQEQEDEKELLLLQLKQLQEELAFTFENLQNCQENSRDHEEQLQDLGLRNKALGDELEQLSEECRHLFQHSQLQPGIDRDRIARILDLVRQSMQG